MSYVVAGPAIGIGGLLCGFLAGLIAANYVHPAHTDLSQHVACNAGNDTHELTHLCVAIQYAAVILLGLFGAQVTISLIRVMTAFFAEAYNLLRQAFCTRVFTASVLAAASIVMACVDSTLKLALRTSKLSGSFLSGSSGPLNKIGSLRAQCGIGLHSLDCHAQKGTDNHRFQSKQLRLHDVNLQPEEFLSETDGKGIRSEVSQDTSSAGEVKMDETQTQLHILQQQMGSLRCELRQERELVHAAETACECEWRRRADVESQLNRCLRELSRIETERDAAIRAGDLLQSNSINVFDSEENSSEEQPLSNSDVGNIVIAKTCELL